MIIRNNVSKLIVRFGFSGLKRIKKRRRSVLKELINDPEAFKLEAFVEGEEIVMKIRKKDES